MAVPSSAEHPPLAAHTSTVNTGLGSDHGDTREVDTYYLHMNGMMNNLLPKNT